MQKEFEQRFVDHEKELQFLEEQYNSPTSSCVVVYGRRRVGKTTLLLEFLKSHRDSLYFLSTEESEYQNKEYFKTQVATFVGNPLLAQADVDWSTIFSQIVAHGTLTKKVIVIDEFQYIGQSNSAFPSVMQKIWDTQLKDANVMLILCGSLISLMQSQVLDYSSPLYGRRTGQIKLKQIPFKYYGEFFPNKTTEELIPFYAVTGGVPKYILSFQNDGDVFSAINNRVLTSQSYLYDEPTFLLQKEVSEVGSYFTLIKAIAMGNHKLADIASCVGVKQTSLTKYLRNLIDLDLVEREVPVTESAPEKSKSGLYKIVDNYIAFWFKFVYPYRAYLEKGETNYVLEKIKSGFKQNYVSFVYEDICREKIWDMAVEKRWDFEIAKVGRYWDKEMELDIVALDRSGKNAVIGECKYSQAEKGLNVLHELQAKAQKLAKKCDITRTQLIIFSNGGFSQGLRDESARTPDLLLVERV